jgi:hypothetical protein
MKMLCLHRILKQVDTESRSEGRGNHSRLRLRDQCMSIPWPLPDEPKWIIIL